MDKKKTKGIKYIWIGIAIGEPGKESARGKLAPKRTTSWANVHLSATKRLERESETPVHGYDKIKQNNRVCVGDEWVISHELKSCLRRLDCMSPPVSPSRYVNMYYEEQVKESSLVRLLLQRYDMQKKGRKTKGQKKQILDQNYRMNKVDSFLSKLFK